MYQSPDLLFSNAALQWINNHEQLVPQLLAMVAEGGQIAWQMPYNFDHPSHVIAAELAGKFGAQAHVPPVLPLERYAELLYKNGFAENRCRLEVYLHPMASANGVVEWTQGTLLTRYQLLLDPDTYQRFEAEYRKQLVSALGEGPYVYAFKRILLWAIKN